MPAPQEAVPGGAFTAAAEKLEFARVRARVMHFAASDPGREILSGLFPSADLPGIREELARVTEMKSLIEQEGLLPLDGIHAVGPALHRSGLEGPPLQPRDLLQIAALLHASRVLRAFVHARRTAAPLLADLTAGLVADRVLEFNIEQAIDETEAVKSTASRELQSIRRAVADRYESLRKRLQGILRQISSGGFSQDEIITTREGRMVLPVKTEFKNQVPGFIHSASASGATVFIEPAETLDLNNEIRSLQFQEQREVERILRALTRQVAALREPLRASLDVLAAADALHAKARYSLDVLGREPVTAGTGPVRLVQARHPLLLQRHGYLQTVPLDLEIGDECRTLVISGPNAGGKSVAMKCVGLLVLMVQSGLHIPCGDGTVLRLFTRVLVDIGDDQSIENDLSTFSSHLRNLRAIVEEADDRSLVLIDEIGAGTDPAEGGAIAAAVLEELTRRSAVTIATTHHGALKAFAHEQEGVENGAMEFDPQTLTPTYRFRRGVPGSSYALDMAHRLGFQDRLLGRARSLMGEQQGRLDTLLTELETASTRARADRDAAALLQAKADEMARRYEEKLAAQKAEARRIREEAVEEARRIVDGANAVIERAVRSIRETSAARPAVAAAREEVAAVKQSLAIPAGDPGAPARPAEPEVSDPLRPGSFVRLRQGGDPGELLTIAPDGRTAEVAFGSVRMRAAVKDLLPAERRPQAGTAVLVTPERAREALRDLDLRGMTGEEALPLVDKFLDDAVLAGLRRVDIIHGKGTGALRKKVTEYLAQDSRVRSFRIAEWNEGGTGATVVELGEE